MCFAIEIRVFFFFGFWFLSRCSRWFFVCLTSQNLGTKFSFISPDFIYSVSPPFLSHPHTHTHTHRPNLIRFFVWFGVRSRNHESQNEAKAWKAAVYYTEEKKKTKHFDQTHIKRTVSNYTWKIMNDKIVTFVDWLKRRKKVQQIIMVLSIEMISHMRWK